MRSRLRRNRVCVYPSIGYTLLTLSYRCGGARLPSLHGKADLGAGLGAGLGSGLGAGLGAGLGLGLGLGAAAGAVFF